ncbi:MAG: DUF4345 family protein [Anaerolineae bacterium]
MLWLTILKIIVAIVTIATGLFSLIKPRAIYGFTGLEASGPRGISEIRAIFGGLFIALGVAPFLFGEGAYLALGLGYLAIAVARAVSILVDNSRAQSNLVSLAIEIVCGLILILRF